MEYIILIAIAFVIAIIVGVVKAKETADNIKIFVEKVKKENFSIDKQIICGDNVLFVDNTNKQWTVKEGNHPQIQIYKFSDLAEFEIIQDGDSIAKGRAGSAIVGGLLFGGVGALVGASRGRKIKNTCNLLELRIRVKNFNRPEIVLKLIDTATKKDSFVYKTRMETARNMAAALSFIQNENADSSVQMKLNQDQTDDTIAKKIRQLSDLRNEGLLTEEEFQSKKMELLSKL